MLSEASRRAFYDRTGSTSESLHHSAGGDDFDWMDFYRSQFHEVVSTDAIEKFAATYKNSEEEKDDILEAYTGAKGDMDHVYETVMLSDVAMDDERIRGIIDEAIKVSRGHDSLTTSRLLHTNSFPGWRSRSIHKIHQRIKRQQKAQAQGRNERSKRSHGFGRRTRRQGQTIRRKEG